MKVLLSGGKKWVLNKSLRAFYLFEAVVHQRAENMGHEQTNPHGQQQGRDDPHRRNYARSACHVCVCRNPTLENEWRSHSLGV